MTVYGKVVNGVFKKAPNKIRVNGRLVLSPRSADYEKAGYLPIDTSNDPPEGYKDSGMWEIRGKKICRKYIEIPPEETEAMEGMRIVSMTQEEAEAFENMEETLADAQAATQEAQAAAEAAQQEAATAIAEKEAAEAALADVSDVMEKIEEVFG